MVFINIKLNWILIEIVLNLLADTESFSSLYYGASLECIVTDLSGYTNVVKSRTYVLLSLTKKIGNQLASNSYNRLQLPYNYIGLSKTNNYVENFVVGTSSDNVIAAIQIL